MKIRDIKSIDKRRSIISSTKNVNLDSLSVYPKGLEKAGEKNCENMVGAVQIPVGIAGPLKLKGDLLDGDYYLPLATTEGALVASVNRGCKAISLSNRAYVYEEFVGITRGSVFLTKGIGEAIKIKAWFDEKFDLLSKEAQKTSDHLKLLKIHSQVVGKRLFIRFYFDTCDAMGMNMITIAVDRIASFVEKNLNIKCLSLAGNFDTDKKPSWINFILGRGRKVWAEVIIDKKIIKNVLKTTSRKIHRLVKSKCYLGSITSGSLGFNAHFANIISAIFIATGQDPAHIVEGSLGITTTELVEQGLYISIYLPDLVLGTVGGGTYLPAQKEALELLGVFGGDGGRNSSRFAKIVAGAVLAGELSLVSSLAEGTLASSHIKLARK